MRGIKLAYMNHTKFLAYVRELKLTQATYVNESKIEHIERNLSWFKIISIGHMDHFIINECKCMHEMYNKNT